MEILEQFPKVAISYLPDLPAEKNKAVEKLLEDWASEIVRRAVNRWLYENDIEV